MPVSALDCVRPAVQHVRDQLFRPFRLGQWTRLAFVGLLAGELFSFNGSSSHHVNQPHPGAGPQFDPALLIPFLIAALIIVPLFWLLFLYINSRMRFILFDSVVTKNCSIRSMWRERRGPAMAYFSWQVILSLVALGGFALLVGVPLAMGVLLGWLTAPQEHVGAIALAVALVLAWAVLLVVVHVFTKDFVVPQMALENISAFHGWSKLMTMIETEPQRYFGYAVLKLVLSIASGIVVTIFGFILLILLLIPIGGFGLFWGLIGHAAGFGWNAFTITLAAALGCGFLLVVLYALALLSVPLIVFFPAYSIYFFSARYPLLAGAINMPSTQLASTSST